MEVKANYLIITKEKNNCLRKFVVTSGCLTGLFSYASILKQFTCVEVLSLHANLIIL